MINLSYPTIYEEIIQKFAINGEIYWHYGLPGHDGLDIKAPYHSNVYAAADGKIIEINLGIEQRFGTHIFIEHADGYKTLYGYLSKIDVNIGDEVTKNQVIGLSGDSNNKGYIHFGLYNKSLERLKNSKYPNGELDPVPFLRYDKENYVAKNIIKIRTSNKEGKNIVLIKNQLFTNHEYLNLVFSHEVSSEQIKKYKKNTFIVVIVDEAITVNNIKPSQYLQSIRAEIEKCYDEGIRYFQIGKSPNLNQNGLNHAWRSPMEFSQWWIDVCSPLKEFFKDIRIGYPSLSQGSPIPGIRIDSKQFMLESGDAIEFANWVAFEYIWQSRKELIKLIESNELKTCAKIAPNKPRLVTGYGQIDYLLTKNEQKQNYIEFEKWIKENNLADFIFKIVV